MKINWDALGITTSIACAIHCAILPLFFASLPLFGIEVIDNIYFEVFMVFLAFTIGFFSLYHGFKKHHHSFLPLIVFSIGFAFLVIRLFFSHGLHWMLIPAVGGIVAAHFMNYKKCRIHNHAHAEDCNH